MIVDGKRPVEVNPKAIRKTRRNTQECRKGVPELCTENEPMRLNPSPLTIFGVLSDCFRQSLGTRSFSWLKIRERRSLVKGKDETAHCHRAMQRDRRRTNERTTMLDKKGTVQCAGARLYTDFRGPGTVQLVGCQSTTGRQFIISGGATWRVICFGCAMNCIVCIKTWRKSGNGRRPSQPPKQQRQRNRSRPKTAQRTSWRVTIAESILVRLPSGVPVVPRRNQCPARTWANIARRVQARPKVAHERHLMQLWPT